MLYIDLLIVLYSIKRDVKYEWMGKDDDLFLDVESEK